MVENFIYSSYGCLQRNSPLNCAAEALTWTGSPKFGLDKMGRHWTRPPTPSMRHSPLLNTSKDGFPHGPPILIPNMKSPASATKSRSCANGWAMNQQRSPPHLAPVNRALPPSPLPFKRSLMRNSAPSPPLTIPTTLNSWLTENMPYTGLADRTYAKWLKDLPLSDVQRNVLMTNIPRRKHGGLCIQLKHLQQFRKLL